MGRPIRRDRMQPRGDTGPTGTSGRIAVTAYRTGGSTTSSTTAYIVAQRGSKRFKIHLEDSSESVYTLVAVAPGSLDTNGTFCVQLILNDSTVAYAEKFYNRTIHYVTAAGAAGTSTYTLGAEGSDEGQAGSGAGSVDVI